MIRQKKKLHFLNQSDFKLRPIVTNSLAFSRALVFLSFHWLLVIFFLYSDWPLKLL